MYILKYSGKIKKDIKLRQKRGYDFQLFEFVLEKLMKPEPLDIKNKDHDLRGGNTKDSENVISHRIGY